MHEGTEGNLQGSKSPSKHAGRNYTIVEIDQRDGSEGTRSVHSNSLHWMTLTDGHEESPHCLEVAKITGTKSDYALRSNRDFEGGEIRCTRAELEVAFQVIGMMPED